MPRQVRTKVGEIHHVRTVKTFADRFKEIATVIAVWAVILVALGVIFR